MTKIMGQVFPVFMVILGFFYALGSINPNGGGYAIAAAILFGPVLIAMRL